MVSTPGGGNRESDDVINGAPVRRRLSDWLGGSALGRAVLGAMDGYTRHATSQFAAAISYRVLFSLVPLVSFVAAVTDVLLPDKQRDAIARWLASVVPGDALDPSVRAVASLGATLLVQVLAELGRDLSAELDVGAGGQLLGTATEILASGALTVGILFVLYRFVPPVAPRARAVWLPALLAAIGFHIATALYGLYLARLGDVTAVYGPLGAVLGFLLVVYVGVIVILLGAELVAAWPVSPRLFSSGRTTCDRLR